MNYGTVSITGRVRDENEDNYLALNKGKIHIIAVADGMGGHKAGDVASSTAIKVIENYDFRRNDIISSVRECINLVNNKILAKSNNSSKYQGMGTTLTLGVVQNNYLVVGHIGDSRAYLYHNDSLKQLTNDHSYVADLLKKGIITKEEAKNHPKKNMLLRALGLEKDIEIDIMDYDLVSGDLLLFCSDGLTNMKSDEEIESILRKDLSLQEEAELLSNKANEAGGYDNITAVLYQNN
ncbi:MAG: Stp1/IreP family PP2C-type Ser/Thr phosphatase [Halanaerobacter sp.]